MLIETQVLLPWPYYYINIIIIIIIIIIMCVKHQFHQCFSYIMFVCFLILFISTYLRWYHTLQGDNSLKSVERFDHMMFVCRFQASR